MPLQRTAITIPEELLIEVDKAADARGESRSKYITRVLRTAVHARRDAEVTSRLNALFADEKARDEQLRTAGELHASGVDWEDEQW